MEREARRQPSPSGSGASVGQVSASDRKHIQLGGEWTVVHQGGKAGRAGARNADRYIQCAQTNTMGRKDPEEAPQASENGHQEAASAAPDEQEAMLFNRSVRRLVSRQEIFQTTSFAEVSA